MPLYLKALDPTIDIFSKEQVLRYNADQINNDANLLLLNAFTATAGIFPSTNISFLTNSFKGFQFKHELISSSIYGNFSLKIYDKFGTSTDIFKYNELTDSLNFFKNVNISGLLLSGNLSLNSNKIINLANGIVNTDGINLGQLNSALAGDIVSNSFTTTGGNISAQTGYLKGNNLSSYNSTNILVTTHLDMNSASYIKFLPTPINNQDAATKQYIDNNSGGAVQSILHGFNNTTYSTNVSVGDHIKFDGVVFVRGSNISLDTTSTYTSATGVASVGRITLAAGKTYKLTGSINNVVSANYNAMRWYNSDTNTALGVVSGMSSPISTTDRVPSAGFIAYITTSVSTRVELRIIWNAFSSVNGTGDGIGPTWFTVEEV